MKQKPKINKEIQKINTINYLNTLLSELKNKYIEHINESMPWINDEMKLMQKEGVKDKYIQLVKYEEKVYRTIIKELKNIEEEEQND